MPLSIFLIVSVKELIVCVVFSIFLEASFEATAIARMSFSRASDVRPTFAADCLTPLTMFFKFPFILFKLSKRV